MNENENEQNDQSNWYKEKHFWPGSALQMKDSVSFKRFRDFIKPIVIDHGFRWVKSYEDSLWDVMYWMNFSSHYNRNVGFSINNRKALRNLLEVLSDIKMLKFKGGIKHPSVRECSKLRSSVDPDSPAFLKELPRMVMECSTVVNVGKKQVKGNLDENVFVKEHVMLYQDVFRGRIDRYNEFAAGFGVNVYLNGNEFKEKHMLHGLRCVAPLHTDLYKVYRVEGGSRDEEDYAECKSYGRMYCHSTVRYQQLPGSVRKRILIDGKKTVELDFDSLHPTMLYNFIGRSVLFDPYMVFDLEGTREEQIKKIRKFMKIAFLIMVGSKSKDKARKAIINKVTEDKNFILDLPFIKYKQPGKIADYIMDRFEEENAPIADFLYREVSEQLQYQDSSMMLEILEELMEQGILGLTIHDSVIVAEEHENVLRDIMTKKYNERYALNIGVS